ncbi:oxygen-independent coproporphyrinogen III oxidase [Halieaceae bacterium IMCC14734]|uniref:Coproporphyrinogen-III oxidase n=1 Tax=Candidatus Litorirhabdus singularis TaxID=2518993 RepID=A0ABT3THR5_9GAMM|nr:oxygen-independent coproporphyrinogen III oxidase [Candidatus Litorirhabdus singularis]MCX2981867.1 oxygen-independent coproporphyrinogen III oxidase [Candidatus Litorirhabdus singularis]
MESSLHTRDCASERLAEKYSGAGPRYTSYPTVPNFSSDFPVADFIAGRRALPRSIQPLSLYVHVPFCRDICYYCACNKVVTREKGAGRRYLDALQREISMQSELYGQRPVTQLHWGGGTPTFLDHAEITELMHELASHFKLSGSPQREYSIEIDPRTVDSATMALLKGLGFNRISLGVQDFDPLVQKAINRIQPYAKVRKLVEDIRHLGFGSLSFDLIYGLPHQDSYSINSTIDRVLELQPDRIACYNYAHLPERFSSQRAIDRHQLPDSSAKLAMQMLLAKRLKAGGYVHIGLDHYVKPEDDLALAQQRGRLQRNFQGYSIQMAQDLVALGASAISQVGDSYFQNEQDLDAYYQRIEAGLSPLKRGCTLTKEDRYRRHIIMGLICNLKLDLPALESQFNLDFASHFIAELEQLEGMQQDGLVELSEDEITVTETGRPFLRIICMVFDQYLLEPHQIQQTLRYSAAV